MSDAGWLLPVLYATEESYGWSVGMRAINHAILRRQSPLPAGLVLELGCGGGRFLGELARSMPDRQVIGVDIHPLALAYAQRNQSISGGVVQSDIQSLPLEDSSAGIILALDTFDQQSVDPLMGLQESWRILRPGGMLVARVSAHSWLQGSHDLAFNTGRRFVPKEFVEAVEEAGFEPLRQTYANALLAAPVASLRLLQRWGILSLNESLYAAKWANLPVAGALRLESVILRQTDLPFGLSFYVVAYKAREKSGAVSMDR